MPQNIDNQQPSKFQEDRRQSCPSAHSLWTQLSIAQQASVSSMHNYGYELSFIRSENQETNAVMILGDAIIMIDEEGSINTLPNIDIRN